MNNWLANNDKTNQKIFIREYFLAVCPDRDYAEFKQELLAAHKRGEVVLKRCDLVTAVSMDRRYLIQESEIDRYHLIDLSM